MRKLVLILAVSAVCLSACGEAANTPAGDVAAPQTKAAISKITPPPARMNYLIGRSLVVKRAVPAQMKGECDAVAKIRKNRSFCRPQINAIARTASFKPKDCSQKAKVVTCKGLVDTKIGSARVVATFQQDKAVWQGKIKNIVDGTFKSKN